MNNSKIIVAVDGYSSCGKSTLAKELAKEINYIFIDSGAMYRAITLEALKLNLIKNNEVQKSELISALPSIELNFKLNSQDGSPEIFLNNEPVGKEIRSPLVSSLVSKIASIKEVREKLVSEQQKMGRNGGIVMDGRDIGSVVFPNAQLKLFITAEPEIRVERRYAELIENGVEISRDEVRNNLVERDHLDSTRVESPLIQATDAIVIDNSELSKAEQLNIALDLVRKKERLIN